MKTTLLALFILAQSVVSGAFAQSLMIDDFESGQRILCGTDPTVNKYLFNKYGVGNDGVVDVTTADKYAGTSSLRETLSTFDGGKSNMQFRPTPCSGASDYMRVHVLDPPSWQFDTYNRLRFWMKMPLGYTKSGNGNDNFHFGTYTRCTTCTSQSYESAGGHWYHHFNLGHADGEWQQLIVDWHPNSKRQVSGSTEQGEKQYPTDEAGYNYFDLMTRWYIQAFSGDFSADPVIFFDDFELYTETRTENVAQVYSLTSVYMPDSNRVNVAWQRDKNENDTVHEVRYAFSDIHTLGFANATFAANATALGFQGYNGMEWSSTAIDMTGQSSIFVAIKPTESSLFRQIEIPLSAPPSTATKVMYTVPAPAGGWAFVRRGGGEYCWRNSSCELDVGQVYFQRQLTSTGKVESWVSCPTSSGCTTFSSKAAATANLTQ